jgi:hypothetical protein
MSGQLIVRLDPDDIATPRLKLRWALFKLREAFEPVPELVYRGPADFILRHGKFSLPTPHNYPMAHTNLCYGNAIVGAEKYGLEYVEGFAMCHHILDPDPPVVMQHGWNETPFGQVVDLTWNTSGGATVSRVNGLAYYGVQFSVDRADVATWTNDATILEDPEHGWPVLREEWKGEDPHREWEISGLLRLMRAKASKETILAWLLANG